MRCTLDARVKLNTAICKFPVPVNVYMNTKQNLQKYRAFHTGCMLNHSYSYVSM